MASIDTIFTKSNLEESKKQAKMLFGRMLIALRKSNHIKLYAMMESVEDMDLVSGELRLTLTDRTAYEMIDNKEDIQALNNVLETLKPGVKVNISCNGRKAFDIHQFETRLIEEFGKKLTIKRK